MYKNLPPTEIYLRIKNIYGEFTISVQYVGKWYRKFKSGHENIISVADMTLENKVDTIIQCDQKGRLSNVVYSDGRSIGTFFWYRYLLIDTLVFRFT